MAKGGNKMDKITIKNTHCCSLKTNNNIKIKKMKLIKNLNFILIFLARFDKSLILTIKC